MLLFEQCEALQLNKIILSSKSFCSINDDKETLSDIPTLCFLNKGRSYFHYSSATT